MNILSPDASGQIDGTVQRNLLVHLPKNLPVDLVPVSYFPNFVFQAPTTQRYVLLDFMEPFPPSPEYDKFWLWVIENPPLLTFQRELRNSEVSPTRKPVEFPCYLPIPPPQSRAEYEARPLEILNWWGFSHLSRLRLHADIFRGMELHGIDVLSQWDHLIDCPPQARRWMTVHVPHWRRVHMDAIVPIMVLSKVMVALPGNGLKTFRHGECVGTLLALWHDDLAWSYPWTNENSLGLVPGSEYISLLHGVRPRDLYPLYLACQENLRHYFAPAYAREYLGPAIQSVI